MTDSCITTIPLLLVSGKSTILKLITRMLQPESGDILLDRESILSQLSVKEVRRRVAVVPQDTSLFDETILYNIRYGNQFATAEEVQAVIADSNLQSTIDKLPQGVRTLVGERGARLSGGERQKVSIAR
jgi:ATP-binding cassette subfamily B protein